MLRRALLGLALVAGAGSALAAETPLSVLLGAGIATPLAEEVLWIPVTLAGSSQPSRIEATLFRPDGSGPFPLAVLNHGSPRDPAERRVGGRMRFAPQSRWFTERGFAVLVPMRRGYGDSDGPWTETEGACDEADFLHAGAETARDIAAAVRFASSRPDVDARRVLLVGVSAGGFGALALASRGDDGLAGVVSFAGGRGSAASGRPCSPQRLVSTLGQYGATTRAPTLWVYAENDSYFAPWLARDMRDAFVRRGGRADLVILPAFGGDGHSLFANPEGIPLWAPHVERFLTSIRFRS